MTFEDVYGTENLFSLAPPVHLAGLHESYKDRKERVHVVLHVLTVLNQRPINSSEQQLAAKSKKSN